jgi:hypothetical protein
MKSRQEIPQWTWYNGQFLLDFDDQLKKNPNLTISQFFQNFLTSQGLQDLNVYHTKNQGTVILLMYGLLVIPREIWERDNTNFEFKTRTKFSLNQLPDSNLETLDFLRLLRNSLAHANFAIDTQNARLKFWNFQRNGTKNFEVEINYGDLGEFLTEVGTYLNEK